MWLVYEMRFSSSARSNKNPSPKRQYWGSGGVTYAAPQAWTMSGHAWTCNDGSEPIACTVWTIPEFDYSLRTFTLFTKVAIIFHT